MAWRSKIQSVFLLLSTFFCFLSTTIYAQNIFDDLLSPPSQPPQNCEFWAGIKTPAKVCKSAVPITYEDKKHYFPSSDFSWSCDVIGNLEFDFFNSSTRTVNTIIIEGATSGTRWAENVHVPPGRSKHVYVHSSGAFCTKEKSARLYFDYRVTIVGDCLANYTTRELQNMKETCRDILAEKRQQDTIFNNCYIDNSRDAHRSAINSIRTVCKQVSKNPTMIQRWRWGE